MTGGPDVDEPYDDDERPGSFFTGCAWSLVAYLLAGLVGLAVWLAVRG